MGLFQPLSESELDALAGLVRFMLSSWFVLWLWFFMQHAKERYGTKTVIAASTVVALMAAVLVHAWRAGWMHEQFEAGSELMRACWSSLLESIASGDWVRPVPLMCLGLLIFLLVCMFLAGASYSSSHRGSRSRWIPLIFLFVTIVCVVLSLVIIVPKARALYSKCGCDSWLPNLERRLDPKLDAWCSQLFCSLALPSAFRADPSLVLPLARSASSFATRSLMALNSTHVHLSKHPLLLIGSPSSGLDLVRAHLGLSVAQPAFWLSRHAHSWLGSSSPVFSLYGGRNPWSFHMSHLHRGLILVVSSTDRAAFGIEEPSSNSGNAAGDEQQEPIPMAKEMINLLFAESERSQPENKVSLPLPLLVLATSQDQLDAFSLAEITRMLGLRDLPSNRSWRVSGCDAVAGEGVAEAAQWLRDTLDATAPAGRPLPRPIRPIRSDWIAPAAAQPQLDAVYNQTSILALHPKSSALPARAILSASRMNSAILTWLPVMMLLLIVSLLSSKRVQWWRAKKVD